MWYRVNRYIYFLLLLCLFHAPETRGQGRNDTTVVITDTTNIDALFRKARDLSRDGNYAQAKRIMIKILERKPNYYEVRTMLGRTYAWDKQYDLARTELSRVLIEKENDYDALNALFDVEFWTESYSVAEDYLKVALGYYPTSDELLLKKAKLEIRLDEKNAAALTLRRVLDLYPGNKEAIRMMNTLSGRKLNNNLTFSALIDLFDNYSKRTPQQQYYAEYSRNFNFGSLIGRITYGDRFHKSGYLYEIESYPHITKSTYLDLLVGWSASEIFPESKFGIEVFQKIGRGFEFSGGVRSLRFTNVTNVWTTSISSYVKDYWLSVRAFITPKDQEEIIRKQTSVTILGYIRRYLGDSENYIGVRGGRGTSADENLYYNVLGYPTVQFAGEFQRRAFGNWLFKVDFTFARESPNKGVYTERYTTQVALKTRF